MRTLYRAAGHGCACVVEALLRAGVDPDGRPAARGAATGAWRDVTTPLHVAAAAGQAAAVRALLAGRARANVPNAHGALPLHLAAGQGPAVLAALLPARREPCAPPPPAGDGGAQGVAPPGGRGTAVAGGADGDGGAGGRGGAGLERARDGNRQTLLHYAARGGRADCVRMLTGGEGGGGVDLRGDVGAVDKWNRQVRGARRRTSVGGGSWGGGRTSMGGSWVARHAPIDGLWVDGRAASDGPPVGHPRTPRAVPP